ncbi:MAG: hypothetical protein JNL74_09105 [Fibrobacteres bacterium]|nr:hypothetical protein [Fibrobacterota bacterium]
MFQFDTRKKSFVCPGWRDNEGVLHKEEGHTSRLSLPAGLERKLVIYGQRLCPACQKGLKVYKVDQKDLKEVYRDAESQLVDELKIIRNPVSTPEEIKEAESQIASIKDFCKKGLKWDDQKFLEVRNALDSSISVFEN